ncbi:hypothetical protein LOZ57_006801 [Ophidiomyces ophidiicola]|uniref:uncharacterized protein n=1 Tax=Ophidiomyces ophidiicola TaxID=1387563 RepID=UPI0020C30BCE|nr:uncharacterized protein LOZ57_006801 [Ophidiomyces ophidiicola]KAI1936157.1 hypothetical protein LOZ57_006801 [Ophidiomyces ophidiicola]KAI2047717.1 hypothetical protein LOZ43_005573 [Ophidiomyces ophidiicola]KAI2083694.1 hypothetical protein LOZ36_005477 [Ophidiomyces ophidiicola]
MSFSTDGEPPPRKDAVAPEGASPMGSDERVSKFSEDLGSPTIPVSVSHTASASPQIFYLHLRLLTRASTYFEKALESNRFAEGQEQKVDLKEVDPDVFGFFVEWLYRDRWEHQAEPSALHETAIPLFTRVYALGQRLLCPLMEEAAARIVYESCDALGNNISDTVVCDLLELSESELPSEDTLGDRILWLAVERLEKLQKFDRFNSLVLERSNLAIGLCRRAGPRKWNREKKVSCRFKRESVY